MARSWASNVRGGATSILGRDADKKLSDFESLAQLSGWLKLAERQHYFIHCAQAKNSFFVIVDLESSIFLIVENCR